jgi:methylenetetrahydrofolate dehydrogenase (NADP+) / methenyltetrahydrofolate cyclohydrolase
MIMDGRTVAKTVVADIATTVLSWSRPPRLTIFTCAPNFETKKFLHLKQQWAKEAGIAVSVIVLPETVTLALVQTAVETATHESDGIIIQFPFPHLATTDLIPLVPASHDIDVMYYTGLPTAVLPPVVGAIDRLSAHYQVPWSGQAVAIVGNGRLVGQPTALYTAAQGALVTVITKESPNEAALKAADIVVLGAGVPGLLQPHMVKPGVVIFDAGTTEEGGQLVGDADPAVATVASLYTPVPGGIGPLTVAVLLKNVLTLAEKRRQ